MRKIYADATHTVWAYVLADGQMRWSDDGEPGGTIAVRNLQSKKQVYAKVKDGGTVIIE